MDSKAVKKAGVVAIIILLALYLAGLVILMILEVDIAAAILYGVIGLVFILWGSYAKKKGAVIDRSRHLVLSSAHPSPLSAYNGFFGNHHFSQANDWLIKHGETPIEW